MKSGEAAHCSVCSVVGQGLLLSGSSLENTGMEPPLINLAELWPTPSSPSRARSQETFTSTTTSSGPWAASRASTSHRWLHNIDTSAFILTKNLLYGIVMRNPSGIVPAGCSARDRAQPGAGAHQRAGRHHVPQLRGIQAGARPRQRRYSRHPGWLHNHKEGSYPTGAFSWLEAPTIVLSHLRHYAKRVLTNGK